MLLTMRACAGNSASRAHAAGQVATTGGAAVITMERGQASGIVQHANGTVWNVTKNYKSGFFSSWNKVGVARCSACVLSGNTGAGLVTKNYKSSFFSSWHHLSVRKGRDACMR